MASRIIFCKINYSMPNNLYWKYAFLTFLAKPCPRRDTTRANSKIQNISKTFASKTRTDLKPVQIFKLTISVTARSLKDLERKKNILKIFPIVAESRTRASYRIRAFLIDKTSSTFDSITINREILIKE